MGQIFGGQTCLSGLGAVTMTMGHGVKTEFICQTKALVKFIHFYFNAQVCHCLIIPSHRDKKMSFMIIKEYISKALHLFMLT